MFLFIFISSHSNIYASNQFSKKIKEVYLKTFRFMVLLFEVFDKGENRKMIDIDCHYKSSNNQNI